MSEREMASANRAGRWWDRYALEPGAWGHWRIGPLSLWVGRSDHDWSIVHVRGDDPLSEAGECRVPCDLGRFPIPQQAERRRVAFERAQGPLELRPLLADRPVIARPETPVWVPPGQRVSAFVSSAVWVRLECGPDRELLVELPTWRASDTWFGDNRSGFLGYASRTALRLDANEGSQRPHRAITPILIDNQGSEALSIERLSLPVTSLSLFVSPTGALWTERLELTRRDDTELAHVHIVDDRPPTEGAQRVGNPRETSSDNLLSRVFTGLFG